MNFATTLLLCLVCSVFAFKVTKDRRSLTDVVSMGRKYRRHSKEVEASGRPGIFLDGVREGVYLSKNRWISAGSVIIAWRPLPC